jgi:hypothetical protein
MTYRHVHRCHKQGQLLPLMLLSLMEQQMLSLPKQLQQQLLQDEILSSIFLQGFKGIFNTCFSGHIVKLYVIESLLLERD